MAYTVLLGTDGLYGSPVTYTDLITFANGDTLTYKIDHLQSEIQEKLLPIGSIITLTDDTDPNEKYEGTWERFAIDNTLISQGEVLLQGAAAPASLTLNDGSQWDMIYHHDVRGGYWAAITDCADYDLSSDQTKFGKLNYYSNYLTAEGNIELLMAFDTAFGTKAWPSVNNVGRWKQQSPINADWVCDHWGVLEWVKGYAVTADCTDIETGCYVPWTGNNNWRGLGRTGITQCYIDGNVGAANYAYAIGTIAGWNGGIPASSTFTKMAGSTTTDASAATIVTLYIRKDNIVLNTKTAGTIIGSNTNTINVGQLPKHLHSMGRIRHSGGSSYADQARNNSFWADNAIGYTGGDQPHNNIQPAVYVYYWVRTA